jgi:hypothetical protein
MNDHHIYEMMLTFHDENCESHRTDRRHIGVKLRRRLFMYDAQDGTGQYTVKNVNESSPRHQTGMLGFQ